MKSLSVVALLAVAAAGPAFAEGKCASAPKSKWQPRSALESRLQADGYQFGRSRSKAAATKSTPRTRTGRRANMAFNAETLEKLDNAEAGEN